MHRDQEGAGVSPDHHAIDPQGCINNLQQQDDFQAHIHIPSVMLPDAEQGYQTPGACRYETVGGVSPLSHLNSIKGWGGLGCGQQ